jgi:hypothetical protein
VSTSNRFVVRWVEGGALRERTISSATDGLALFDRVHLIAAVDPTMVAYNPVGTSEEFCIGAGRDLTVLTYQRSLDPPYFASRGDDAAHGLVSFLYAGEPSEFLLNSAVPVEHARRALTEYLGSRRLPTSIRWDEA